ncbi:hypothetical protein EsDP_00005886 [Epichloe bromicola]|uniref:Major facilitator superfamily (MFS) profile domain-containing protein n=1 Tax=Epichloe bromicola TaxID=79588 RepID=A0ABQ0CW00_9HYPO
MSITNMSAKNLKSFEHLLSNRVSVDDTSWIFDVSSLPPADVANQASLIVLISLSTSDMRHKMTLRYDPVEMNRAIREASLDQFIVVSFSDFRSIRPSAMTEGRVSEVTQPTTGRECCDYMVKMLRAGIFLNGRHFNFYGHSNSQLKSRTCYLRAAPRNRIATQIESLGDFTKLKTVAKKAKRIGLLFSTARVVMNVDPERVEDISDIVSGDYIFTDGCGLIARKFAQELSRRARIVFRDRRYTPSVFQLRYRGYKGVVTVDPNMAKTGPWLRMRKSMKKFSGGQDTSFAVVEYSKPYAFGYLNDEIIVLLDALGIDRQILLRKQREHFDFIISASRVAQAAFRFLSFLNKPDMAEKVLLESIDAVRPTIQKLIRLEFDKMLNKREEQKCRILIPQSRLLFGVCDAWGVLKEGQCAVKVTMDHDGQPYALKGTNVLVTRNPCLHPGDLQKFDAVAHPQLAHLVDCIVFPVVGRRPAADLMSGGDLDGDTFFVTWDPEIIPTTVAQAAYYPAVREKMQFSAITDDDRILHFARYTNASLGRVKNIYLRWARVRGAMSPECQELNRLFSQCVDGNKIKDSQLAKFERSPAASVDAPLFILDELHELAEGLVSNMNEFGSGQLNDDSSLDDMEELLSREDFMMSEAELVKLSVSWCRKMNVPFSSILHVFNMNDLGPEEKSWVLAQVPTAFHYPKLVLNALCSSELAEQHDLDYFQLSHQGMHWKRVYTSSEDRLATFMDAACRNLEVFHKTLILFRPNERLTVAVYVPQKVVQSDDFLVGDRVRVFAFPHTQGTETRSRLCLPTKKGYRLYCDDNVFQLFDEKRSNTWIFINRSPSDEASYRNLSRGQDRRAARMASIEAGINHDFRASIALDKFSRGLQQNIGRVNRDGILAAVYNVNRDTRSMRHLDLWENMIDTDEELPLFDLEAEEYDVPLLREVDWSLQARLVAEVVHHGNYALLKQRTAPPDLRHLFDWLIDNSQGNVMIRCYNELVDSITPEADAAASEDTLQVLMEFVPKAPYCSAPFSRLDSWSSLPDKVEAILQNNGPLLLRSMILAESEHGQLVVAPFRTILSNLSSLSFGSFTDVVETVALTVHRVDVALELLLGCLERDCDRLLVGRPSKVRFFVRNIVAIALDRVSEIQQNSFELKQMFRMTPDTTKESTSGQQRVQVSFRIDAPGTAPKANTHIRFSTASPPKSSALERTRSVDGLVVESNSNVLKVACLHPLPPFFQECSWKLQDCGLFVTTQTMLEAVRKLAILENDCCGVADQITGVVRPSRDNQETGTNAAALAPEYSLNETQCAAVRASQNNKLLCIWGPPGTGKTQTIVAIIRTLQSTTKSRLLITAPTHNAVDNVMRRYLAQLGKDIGADATEASPLRVSTEVRKVADDLRPFTCDALVGQEIYTNQNTMRKAKQRVKAARIIFTTCIGAGLGLLRGQTFDVVIVDEASQQTEPASLVPLVSGCSKAVLVGDHVQLRPSVQNTSLAVDFDVSLFERLYTREGGTPGMGKIMLDKQYRMHPFICSFASREFYSGKLLSGIHDCDRPLPKSRFPWSHGLSKAPPGEQRDSRIVFVESAGREDLGHKSKSNQAQAELCVSICKLLLGGRSRLSPDGRQDAQDRLSLAVLTPYTRQRELLSKLLRDFDNAEVSSIDGFQGREADVVVFVSVRCNENGEVGFLKDQTAAVAAYSADEVEKKRQTAAEAIAADRDKSNTKQKKEYASGFKLVIIVVSLCLSLFLCGLDQTIITTAVPIITNEFKAIEDVGCLWQALHRFVCQIVLLIAFAIFELGSVICAAAPNSTTLIVGRAIAGLGAAGIFQGSTLVLVHAAPMERRPALLGTNTGIFGIAGLCGPFIGGAFADGATWRWCFIVNVPLGVITTVILTFFVTTPVDSEYANWIFKDKLILAKIPEILILVAALVCLVLGI